MEELKQAFYEVMYKYEKEFGEAGVMANLNAWARNKALLLELLRRHPAWNEETKAIVFTFDEGRGIEHDVVDEIAYAMEDRSAYIHMNLPFHISFLQSQKFAKLRLCRTSAQPQ